MPKETRPKQLRLAKAVFVNYNMISIKLKIKDVEVELSMQEAEELYGDLHRIFKKDEYKFIPYREPSVPWTQPFYPKLIPGITKFEVTNIPDKNEVIYLGPPMANTTLKISENRDLPVHTSGFMQIIG